jgi:hypothetical protein
MPDPERKGSQWKSLLSALLDAGAEPQDIYLAEVAPGDEWDFAFWNYGPDGAMCSYRCKPNRSIWVPIETPAYTGEVKPWNRARDDRSQRNKRD